VFAFIGIGILFFLLLWGLSLVIKAEKD